MPTYLLHGFRWHRSAIRIHIALYNLEDAAAEWIVAPATSITLLNSFYTLYDFLPPSLSPSQGSWSGNGIVRPGSVNGFGGGAQPLILKPQSSFDSVPVGRGNGITGEGGAEVNGHDDAAVQPPAADKPRNEPIVPVNGTDGITNEITSDPIREEALPKSPAPPRVLTKSKTRSMGSLRGFGKRRPEHRPTLPDLPGGFTNGAVMAQNGNANGQATTPKATRERSTSTSIKRPSTASTDYSRPSRQGSDTVAVTRKKPAFNEWSVVKLVEQYDPNELRMGSQPHAYVADHMIEVKLGVSITEETAKYEAKMREEVDTQPSSPVSSPSHSRSGSGFGLNGELSAREVRKKSRRVNWFEKLRDQLQKGEEVGWFIVVCGDEERACPTTDILPEEDEDETWSGENKDNERLKTPRSAGFRGLWGSRSRRKQQAAMEQSG
ncbi:hypothetical protein BP5796_01323 [Coleophoma crateriformis]|uniref:Developmental regulator protein n=1 Tax=Coleophoma crateriformis TaxID=565419 RepID=A0A3D8T0A1_9HELO|nr:hypothetical protein BP5796_01323 [Coleophoma crateriformis]